LALDAIKPKDGPVLDSVAVSSVAQEISLEILETAVALKN